MSEVTYTTDPDPFQNKEQAYIETRRIEGRLLEDEAVSRLPHVPKKSRHWQEWRIRERNLKDFLRYWSERGGPLRILDLGCGNGWMSHHLAQLAHSQVTGMDLNQVELDQAARVFAKETNLRFVYGDVYQDHPMTYDCIVLAASMQYFPDPQGLVNRLLELLDDGGELHVIESKFYGRDQVEDAQRRSSDYYQSLGQDEMTTYYFHHCLEDMLKMGAETLHEPQGNRGRNRRLTAKSPFHWLRFSKKSTVI